MTAPVNIYLLSRITDEESFRIAEDHLCRKDEKARTQYHEMESLRRVVGSLMDYGLTINELDGFYYGYHIPRIGKEFDLLRISDSVCVNIELKSQEVSEDQILHQLLKNRYYLSHLGRRLYLYTVVTNTMDCYRLSVSGELIRSDMREIAASLHSFNCTDISPVDELFRASEYLVSPIETPEKFIQGEYFLTQAQEQVKKELLAGIEASFGASFFHIYGRAGTGKTLMIYDIAKALAKNGKVLMIHCGPLHEGQRQITRALNNLTVLSDMELDAKHLEDAAAGFLLADEMQRISLEKLDLITEYAQKNNQVCIFCTDHEQILTASEMENNIPQRIRDLGLAGEYQLSEKLRMNKELFSFLLCMKNPAHKEEQHYSYSNVEVNYADTTAEAQTMLGYYKEKGYTFINYARTSEEFNPFSDYEEDFDVLHIIGREFDRAVILMDRSFYYDDEGRLQGIPYPNPDYMYPNLFYQGVTRVREKLAVIVVRAPQLFKTINGILKQ